MQLRKLMVVGIDCYHDPTSGKRSVGALVASLNKGMSRFVQVSVMIGRVEFLGSLYQTFIPT